MTINPPFRATYRLQLHHDFTFADAQKLLPYLEDLGISHLYLSPIFESRRGSDHGYDGVDPRKISRERGGETQFARLMRTIEERRALGRFPAGVILDLVPNHLATSNENPYWMDVLKHGRQSRYWPVFDIRSEPILLPVLGKPLIEVLRSDELSLKRGPEGWLLSYYDQNFPIAPETKLDELLIDVLRQQHYRLEEWRTAVKRLNYRRFFDINHLIGVRVENERVFRWSHAKVIELARRFIGIDGVRIDHIDGLLNPEIYLQRLKRYIPFIWVEKILADDESIPNTWPVQGSTGYDFSIASTRLFANESGHQRIHDYYLTLNPKWRSFADCVHDSKREILHLLFESEFRSLLASIEHYLERYPEEAPRPFVGREALQNALEELTLALKPYRLYPYGQDERTWLHDASEAALRRGQVQSQAALEWWVIFLATASGNPRKSRILGKWHQLSGPLTAKGLEDTALYRYFPLLSLNSVGAEPDWNYNTVIEFHSFNQERLKNHPLSLSASTTHDTKRDEDVQSRIHVLSEVPEKWIDFFHRWRSNSKIGTNFEYFIYQTLLGVWPLSGKVDSTFLGRMKAYFLKAAREAKLETNWLKPNEEYEAALMNEIESILDPQDQPQRFEELSRLAEFTAYFGAFNSLSALALKILSPGIPDIYQGTELWSYSLVDPDNRRPVDYELRSAYAKAANEASTEELFSESLFENWKSGEIKFRITRELLKVRHRYDAWFERGKYLPLEVKGKRRNEVIAFARWSETEWVIVVVPRFLATAIAPSSSLQIPANYFEDTILTLPPNAPQTWVQSFTYKNIEVKERNELELSAIFDRMPIGIIESGSSR